MANFNFNKVILGGRLTADPELRSTQNGVMFTSFSVAVNRRFSGANNEQQTDFINCTAWRQQAEFISRYFRKGSSICVVGSIQTRSWTDQASGQKRYATEVAVDEVQFVDAKGEAPAARQGGAAPYGAAPAVAPYTPASYGGSSYAGTPDNAPRFEEMSNEDDLPF